MRNFVAFSLRTFPVLAAAFVLSAVFAPTSAVAGPIHYASCDPTGFVHVVAGTGSASGNQGVFTPNPQETVGVQNLVDAAKAGAAALSITTPNGVGIYFEPGAFLDLGAFGNATLSLTAPAASVVFAGGIKMPVQRALTISSQDVAQIVCPTSGAIVTGVCPNSNGMSAAIFVGELVLNVIDGVGESSCPKGQLVVQDISKITLNAAPNSPQRLCVNMFSSFPGGMNIEVVASNLGGARYAFLRLNNNNALVRSAPKDPTALLFLGQGVPLCY